MSLQEVDQLIFRSLDRIECDFEGATTLEEISADNLVESVVKCLRLIIPTKSQITRSTKLPPGMTARFRFCTELADCIKKDLGFRGDLGYQSLLYASVIEKRRLLMFLVEKLPKDVETKSEETSLSERDRIMRQAGRLFASATSEPWKPWFCERYHFRWDGKYWIAPETLDALDDVIFHAEYLDASADCVIPIASQCANFRNVPASVIEFVTSSQTLPSTASTSRHRDVDVLLRHVAERQRPRPRPRGIKPALMPKPRKLAPKPAVPEKPSHLGQRPQSLSSAEQISVEENEIGALQSGISQVISDAVSVENENSAFLEKIEKLTQRENRVTEETKRLSDELKQKQKYAAVHSNPEESVKILQEYLTKSDERLEGLQQKFETAQNPVLAEIEKLRGEMGIKSETKNLRVEISEMADKMAEIRDSAFDKDKLSGQLNKAIDKIDTNIVTRSAYTKRILDIVASIRKQREEIHKIIQDTSVVQRDIHMLTGKLDRSFTATDELIFKGAKTDEKMRRSYKLLATLHEQSACIVKAVEVSGQLVREVIDIEEQIDSESQRSESSKLDSLLKDLYAVKQENEILEQKLK